jgi:hypothetical protein
VRLLEGGLAIVQADPNDHLVLPTGALTGNQDHWEELPRLQSAFEPVIERIRFLAGHGLSLMIVLSDFLSRRIAPLQSRVRPGVAVHWGGQHHVA